MDILKTLTTDSWQEHFSVTTQTEMTRALESGQILFFPKLSFQLTANEQQFLLSSSECVSSSSKNISYNKNTDELRGFSENLSREKLVLLNGFLERYADQTQQFVHALFPHYIKAIKVGRTSFRPVEINGRASSYRKDDKRLHVDAFPANPNHGWRILRVFCNVNPNQQARVWRVGEPFEEVAKQFLPTLKNPFPFGATFLQLLRITKRRRMPYDHFMLQLHDAMKKDMVYQRNAHQQEIHFPAQSTWVVQTDHVSHAAMSGQYLLEQTFYLPVNAMLDESKSPLRVLEKLLKRRLV